MKRSAALLLSLVIVASMGLESANYLFRHPIYELGDAAANSLSVDRAQRFSELYGAYSRWGFHHPGPALFYVQAFGQWLFFHVLHIVPAPFNGQVLIDLIVEAGFFVAALHVFTQWLTARCRWWFLPLAILLGALHFGDAAHPHDPGALPTTAAFVAPWGPHQLVLIFLCLLTAAASVAAGRGEDLPLLVLAGGCLVHLHVAQPMFVVPCALLGYAGLVQSCAARKREDAVPRLPWWRRGISAGAGPWQQYRRAHWIAGMLLSLFVLPLVVDLTRGAHSNLLGIVDHVRGFRPEHKSLLKSLLYFLQFGAYETYKMGQPDFGDFQASGVWGYFRAHAGMFAVWAVTFGLCAWVIARQFYRWSKRQPDEPTGRFLAWAGVYLALGIALTLRWGVIQDGDMYYFNAFFNFGIYYFAALIASAEVVRLAVAAATRWSTRGAGALEWSTATLLTLLSLAIFGRCLRMTDGSWRVHLATHETLVRTIRQASDPGAVVYLDFPQSAWPLAVGVALELSRAGEKFAVSDRWRTMFGPEYPPELELRTVAHTRYRKWTIIDPTGPPDQEGAACKWVPLEDGVSLTTDSPPTVDVDHVGVTVLDFRVDAISPLMDIQGWTGAGTWGEWSLGKEAIAAFPAMAVSGDVELRLNAFPFIDPPHGLSAQRVRVYLNGEQIRPELRLTMAESLPIKLIIPQAVWNRALAGGGANEIIRFDLPDAIAPQDLDTSKPGDVRTLALGVRRLALQAVQPAPAGTENPAPPSWNTADAQGAIPQEYAFNGKAISPAYFQGISEDGWVGPQATVLLPRTASPAPFLRLDGFAQPGVGLTYPARFTIQVNDGPAVETTVAAAGNFDLLLPLPAGTLAGNIRVRLSFAQTFVPLRVEAGSHDSRQLSVRLHSLRITSAEQPVLGLFGQGWYEHETDQQDWWRWSNADSVIVVAAERAGTLVVTGQAASLQPGNAVDVDLDGTPFSTQPIPTPTFSRFELRVPVSAGKHLLQFHSHLPGTAPAGDPRVLAFKFKNVEFKLQ